MKITGLGKLVGPKWTSAHRILLWMNSYLSSASNNVESRFSNSIESSLICFSQTLAKLGDSSCDITDPWQTELLHLNGELE